MTVAVPDFGGLASQQNTANNAATNLTNQANRPTQYDPMGSVTWSQDANGNWTQSSNLSATGQALWDSASSGMQNLSGQIGQGLSTDGLINWGSTDLTSNLGTMPQVGQYNQQVIDAWNALQQPGLQQQSDAARARAAAMGITLGSNASNDVERTIGNNWTDASNKAILAGYTQGNTEYQQALDARKQGYTENLGSAQLSNSERQQQMAERTSAYQAALSGRTNLQAQMDDTNQNTWAGKVPTSAAYIPQTIYGAAQDTFNANMQNQNADTAARNANVSAASSLGSSILGSTGAMNLLGSAAGGAWNWLSNAWGSNGSSDALGDFISSNGW